MRSHTSLPSLDVFPVFNREQGLKNFGYNLLLLREMIQAMVAEIPHETVNFHHAYTQKDWRTIEELAHKMKGVSAYIGIIKLQYACQYLESYCHKGGPLSILEHCYHQVIEICNETQKALQAWLNIT